MNTVISSKGQVVLPAPVRRRLGLSRGTELEVTVEAGHVLLFGGCQCIDRRVILQTLTFSALRKATKQFLPLLTKQSPVRSSYLHSHEQVPPCNTQR